MQDEMISVREISDRTGKRTDQIYALLQQGEFPVGTAYKNPGGKWSYIIPRLAFENWMGGLLPPTAEQIADLVVEKLKGF